MDSRAHFPVPITQFYITSTTTTTAIVYISLIEFYNKRALARRRLELILAGQSIYEQFRTDRSFLTETQRYKSRPPFFKPTNFSLLISFWLPPNSLVVSKSKMAGWHYSRKKSSIALQSTPTFQAIVIVLTFAVTNIGRHLTTFRPFNCLFGWIYDFFVTH